MDGIAEGTNKTTVTNSLTSTSTTNALSAYQGKVLNDKITNSTIKNSNKAYTTDANGFVKVADYGDTVVSAVSTSNNVMISPIFLGNNNKSYYVKATDINGNILANTYIHIEL